MTKAEAAAVYTLASDIEYQLMEAFGEQGRAAPEPATEHIMLALYAARALLSIGRDGVE